jgi:MoaA/NifB/PqqE/SkfB family radical SAM enzyme
MSGFKRTISLAYRGLYNYVRKIPFAISIEVTHSCNANCAHCHLGGPVKENRASPEKYGELVRQIKPLVAQLSGGEPLLRKDLEEIVSHLRNPNKAPYIIVTTNGTILTPKRYASLMEAGVDTFSLSLDYPDERHDVFRGVPGLFGKIDTLIRELKQHTKPAITLCCVIQSDNYRDLMKMAELAQKWGVKLNLSCYTYLRTHDKKYMLSKDQIEEFKEIIERLLEFNRKNGLINTSRYVFNTMIEFFKNESIPNCQTGYRFCNINPDGTFSPCGLIITSFKSREELIEKFSKTNTCTFCYTSIRANAEKPLRHLLADSFRSL